MAANYDDVLGQLRAAGLIVDSLRVGAARPVRCKVEGDREKRGWYMLHELQTSSGDVLLVGTFGVWSGNDAGTQKIALRKSEQLTPEQRDALRRRQAEDRKRAEAERQREADRAAVRAAAMWSRLSPTGDADYLARKAVGAYGLRFTPTGSAVVPLLDATGKIHGLQFLRTAAQAEKAKRPDKEFWPAGVAKKGHFHLIGLPQDVVLLCEGYATGASLHMATQLPVAIAFDAGNLLPVAQALRKHYRRVRVLVCADDDGFAKCPGKDCGARFVLATHPADCPACGLPHGRSNAGVTAASTVALDVEGAWLAPRFVDEPGRQQRFLDRGHKLTDFNDLHATDGLHAVTQQVATRLSELGWQGRAAPPPTTTTGGEGARLKPIGQLDELLERFALVYGHGGTVFDKREHQLLSLGDMRDACLSKDVHRAWMGHPGRDIVRISNVGFDPAGTDPEITCNLWGGWPTTPRAGRCQRLLDLLRYICSAETHPDHVYRYLLRWLAYPIQHPGAKMKSCLVMHGPQGAGKNLFFEAYMEIFGQYGRVIGQDAIEDKFNDWASRKLFLIADEVIARSEVFHLKNKLKSLVTGDWIRINPKGVAAYDERNHANLVFLSNEAMPVVLEEDDRRHCVVWTPPEKDQAYYAAVRAEIADGGVAALHDYLLHLDLGDFQNGTRPPLTAAKAELIKLGLDSTSRFVYDLETGEIPGMTARPCLTSDLYDLYRHWCQLGGHRAAPLPKLVNVLHRKHDIQVGRKRYHDGLALDGGPKVSGPHGVALIGEAVPPPGEPEQAWLGRHIATFGAELRDLKGRKNG